MNYHTFKTVVAQVSLKLNEKDSIKLFQAPSGVSHENLLK